MADSRKVSRNRTSSIEVPPKMKANKPVVKIFRVKNMYHTSISMTINGVRYYFDPMGEQTVSPEVADVLLKKTIYSSGCCGAGKERRNLFVEV